MYYIIYYICIIYVWDLRLILSVSREVSVMTENAVDIMIHWVEVLLWCLMIFSPHTKVSWLCILYSVRVRAYASRLESMLWDFQRVWFQVYKYSHCFSSSCQVFWCWFEQLKVKWNYFISLFGYRSCSWCKCEVIATVQGQGWNIRRITKANGEEDKTNQWNKRMRGWQELLA